MKKKSAFLVFSNHILQMYIFNMDIDEKNYYALVILSSCTCMNTYISVYILTFDVIIYLYAGK